MNELPRRTRIAHEAEPVLPLLPAERSRNGCSRILRLPPQSSSNGYAIKASLEATRLSKITCKPCGRRRKPGAPSFAWSPQRLAMLSHLTMGVR